jgi:uncharacterized protein (TIRG00374 family)
VRIDWKNALGFALSALLLWWTLHDQPLGSVWAAVRDSDWRLWLASTVAATLIFPLRARRWRTILGPLAAGVPFGPLWRATAIGMMVNNIAPARAGELARAYAFAREVPRVPLATAFASLAVDRVFDALVLLMLLFAAPLDPSYPRGGTLYGRSVPALAQGGAAAVAALLVALYGLVAFPGVAERVFRYLARRVAPRLEARGADALRAFAAGLSVLRSPGRFAAVFAWTLAHWALAAWSIWLGFRAVGITVPFSAAVFLNSVSSVATALPSSPGFFGVFESVSKVVLQLYGVGATQAVSWALGYHLLTFVPITVIGAVYAVRLGLGFGELTRGGKAPAPRGAPAEAAGAEPDAGDAEPARRYAGRA